MCDYCETACDRNDSGREFGKLFDKSLDCTGEIQLSWIKENEMKTGYELYMNDDTVCTDLSVPVDFCPKCGRNLNMNIDEKWVLCNERLPEYYDEVFVTIEENGKRYATIGHLLGNRRWNTVNGKEAKYTKNVIAWSPFKNAINIVVLYNGELN